MLKPKKYIYPTSYNNFGIHRTHYKSPTIYAPRKYKFTSRYKNVNRLYDDNFNLYYHQFGKKFTISETNNDVYFKVTKKEENRLDIIANKYYGTATYWWVIALANNILDGFTVEMGTVLRIPEIGTLFNIGGVLA